MSAAAAAALWLAVSNRAGARFDWAAFGASMSNAHWGWAAISLVPIVATFQARALRWRVFMGPLGDRCSTGALFRANVIGFAAIALLGRPGELIRPYLVATKARVPAASQFAICVLERVVDLLIAFALFGFALKRTRSLPVHPGPELQWALAAGGQLAMWGSLALLAVFLCFRPCSNWLRRGLRASARFLPAAPLAKADGWIAGFAQGAEATRSPGAILRVAAYSAGVWASIAAFYWCLVRALDATAGLSSMDVLVLTGLVSFGAAVQIPGIGGGVQVAAIAVLTQLFGVRLEAATSFAALIWALSTASLIPAGLALTAQEGIGWRRLRAAASQAAG